MQKAEVKIKKSVAAKYYYSHRSVLTALCWFFLALCSLLLAACEEKIKPSVSTGLGWDVPSQESWDAKIIFTDSGKVTGILHAGHIAMYTDKKFTLLDSNITVDFFNERQEHTSILTAKRGKVDDVTHDFEAHDHVLVISDSGTTLVTEELFWTNATRKIHSSAYVDITSPKEHLLGQGFESDQGLKHYTILKVTGQAKSHE
jgi:LPS export ABC transporter protein LptC